MITWLKYVLASMFGRVVYQIYESGTNPVEFFRPLFGHPDNLVSYFLPTLLWGLILGTALFAVWRSLVFLYKLIRPKK
jgi:hypothetical protein